MFSKILAASFVQTVLSTHSKRGVVASGPQTCDDPILLGNLGWYYDYNMQDPYQQSGLSGDCSTARQMDRSRFTPMNWCLSSMHDEKPSYDVGAPIFMGFNEPNNIHNCNTHALDVAKAWGTIMQQWPNSALVSPATAGNGIQWYEDFFRHCQELYGSSGCRISYLATHCYHCHASDTMAYLKQLHDKFKLPIWLTEFSCGTHEQGRPTSDHKQFMKEILPKLDGADFVYRYAWMSARDPSNLRGLVETVNGKAQLTELGQIYNTFGMEVNMSSSPIQV
jgi:hypothetical protein